VLSLTVIRMVPAALSLFGSGVRGPTTLFLGWFGPRGLASILFALLVLEEAGIPLSDEILQITILTVALSILAHGITAAPASRWYAGMVARMGERVRREQTGQRNAQPVRPHGAGTGECRRLIWLHRRQTYIWCRTQLNPIE
jgi:NhaP-type Na+/H+ or K+/H+ antiporter